MSLTGVAWYMLPLAMVISLVYSASRYELPEYILSRALKLFVQIVVFMMIAFGILWVLTYAL
jgi:hypothetical protein